MSKSFENITGAELLRADAYSQKIYIADEKNNLRNLVDESKFWGYTSPENCLYYDYKDETNHGWAVPQDGWNDYSQDISRHLTPYKTEEWINNKVFCNNISTLSVIQGYAGCGKTIFINSLLQKRMKNNDIVDCIDIYIDYDNNATESGYLPLALRNHMITQIMCYLSDDDGLKIYQKFIENMAKYSQYSASFSDILTIFRQDGKISLLARQLFDSRNELDKLKEIETNFRIHFVSSTLAISGALKGKLHHENIDIDDFASIKEQYIKLLLENYLVMDFIFIYSVNLIKNQGTKIIFFDNLDIIDNPQHIGYFINKLQEVLHKITICFKRENILPIFKIIIAVRKVTYALVSSFVEVRDSERGFNDINVNFLDISNLYSSTRLLKHKAYVLLNNFQEYVPEEYDREDVRAFLEAVINIPEETLKDICLPDLFNHNIRACANILERAMKHSSDIIPTDLDINKLSNKCNSAIWIHSICAVLQENHIWSNLGYNTSDVEITNYPTTLARLILTYLYNQRRNSRNNKENFTTTEVSFKKIVEMFEKLPFASSKSSDKSISENIEKNYTKEDTHIKIVNAISNMLRRNIESDGINPKSEMELWRRPIYFTNNAFSLTDEKGNDNIQNELIRQIQCFDYSNASITDFCITDEGYTFIEKIATNFEFYSVRYNNSASIPICYLTDENRIDGIVYKVYTQVEKCIRRHRWLMDFYIQKYGKSQNDPSNDDYINDVNEYLLLMFHPRTDNGYKPQLHVVRTIYDHIYYLNDYRDYLIKSKHHRLKELNKCLVKWIGKYLELYRANLYSLLDPTIGSFNEVFLKLKYLYWRVYSDANYLPYDDSGKKEISISTGAYKSANKISVDNKKLLDEPMLIEEDGVNMDS